MTEHYAPKEGRRITDDEVMSGIMRGWVDSHSERANPASQEVEETASPQLAADMGETASYAEDLEVGVGNYTEERLEEER